MLFWSSDYIISGGGALRFYTVRVLPTFPIYGFASQIVRVSWLKLKNFRMRMLKVTDLSGVRLWTGQRKILTLHCFLWLRFLLPGVIEKCLRKFKQFVPGLWVLLFPKAPLIWLFTNVFQFLFFQASERIENNLKSLSNKTSLSNDTMKKDIAADVVQNLATVPAHPLGFWIHGMYCYLIFYFITTIG